MKKYIVIFVTCASGEEALSISKKLLSERLIACANIIEGVSSIFRWKGKVEKATESLVVIKTAKKNFTSVKRRIRELHSYEVPEIIALPIMAGEADYLKWIDKCIKK